MALGLTLESCQAVSRVRPACITSFRLGIEKEERSEEECYIFSRRGKRKGENG